jgi:hypothetical protein
MLLNFNLKSTDSGSKYNVTKTTTFFRAYHDEADTNWFAYITKDLAQSTAFQNIIQLNVGNDNDVNCSGYFNNYLIHLALLMLNILLLSSNYTHG